MPRRDCAAQKVNGKRVASILDSESDDLIVRLQDPEAVWCALQSAKKQASLVIKGLSREKAGLEAIRRNDKWSKPQPTKGPLPVLFRGEPVEVFLRILVRTFWSAVTEVLCLSFLLCSFLFLICLMHIFLPIIL